MKQAALEIVKKLQMAGHEAYWVGGCVRDLILHHEPEDYDIATSALPEDIVALWPKAKAIGVAFGVMLVRLGDHDFEVATFRTESDYLDGRRPSKIEFSTAEADAQRRDFTINGIFYDPLKDKFVDYVDGRSDLRRGLLRFIGDPDERIQEDFLRILRAVRFKHRFDLEFHVDTASALARHSSLVTEITVERILSELNKIIIQKSNGAAFHDGYDLGILSRFFPEIETLAKTPQPRLHHLEGDVLTHSFLVLDHIPEGEDLALYWAAFLHDFGKGPAAHYEGDRVRFPDHARLGADIAKQIAKRLKFPKRLTDDIAWLIEKHHWFDNFDQTKLVHKLQYYDHPQFKNLLKLHRADIYGCIPAVPGSRQKPLDRLLQIEEDYRYAHQQKLLPSYKQEFFTGEEIMQITGLKPGKKVGELKAQLHELQVLGKIKTKTAAKKWLKKPSPL